MHKLPSLPIGALALGLTFAAAPARAAYVDLQIMGGSCSTTFDGGTDPTANFGTATSGRTASRFAGTEYGVAALIHPLHHVPFAVGGFALQQNYQGEASDYGERLNGLQAGADMMVWAPIRLLQPYLRAGYDLYGNYKYTASSSAGALYATGDGAPTKLEIDGNVSGYHTAVGLRVRPMPFVGAFLQYDVAQEAFSPQRATFTQSGSGLTADVDGTKKSMSSRALEIGVDMGI